ncbi:MAG: exodeoxyribonuclease V subunit beta, partial [Variovorax sp.]
KVLNGNSYRRNWVDALCKRWPDWCQAGAFAAPPDERIARLTTEALQGNANKNQHARVPASPMSAAIEAYLDALRACEHYVALRRGALLHRIRDDARARLAVLKRQRRLQTYDDLIDGVADALEGDTPRVDALVANLRSQYAVALVDEFQDTDARQWAIFRRVFGKASSAPALFLIGDPKQAIYGFRGEVGMHVAAGRDAEPAPPLSHNFRSRPGVLAAIAALYAQAGPDGFVDPGIGFREVQPGGKRADADFLRDGAPAPALTLWRAPQPPLDDTGKRKPWRADQARTLATQACVAAIHAVLTDARAGKATIDGEPVQPGDIAVLVRSHLDATRMQQALALAGIPAVAAGKQSLFATGEARDLHALLLALLQSGDDGRLRAALATVLV